MAEAKGTIVLTGANGGLGSAIAAQIASSAELAHYHGVYTARDAAAAAPTLAAALKKDSSSHQSDVVSLDLTDLDNVRKVAQDINNRVSSGAMPPIRALILNAGSHSFALQTWTSDGLDTTFAANYLGHWLLTLLLLQSMDKEGGRIVVLGSQTHDTLDPRNGSMRVFNEERFKQIVGNDEASVEAIATGAWSTAKEDPSFRSGVRRYGAAKLMLVMMIYELQRRLDKDAALANVAILGVDPGSMMTGLPRNAPWHIRVLFFQIVFPIMLWLMPNGPVRSTDRSGSDVLEAAFGSGLGGQDGPPKALYFDGREPRETSAECKDLQKRNLVWDMSVRRTHIVDGETVLGDWK